MAQNYKRLGSKAPAAATEIDLYQCPTGSSTVVSSILVATDGSTGPGAAIKIAIVASGGVTTTTSDYIANDVNVPKNLTDGYVYGITLTSGNIIRVETDKVGVSFNAFGVEIS